MARPVDPWRARARRLDEPPPPPSTREQDKLRRLIRARAPVADTWPQRLADRGALARAAMSDAMAPLPAGRNETAGEYLLRSRMHRVSVWGGAPLAALIEGFFASTDGSGYGIVKDWTAPFRR